MTCSRYLPRPLPTGSLKSRGRETRRISGPEIAAERGKGQLGCWREIAGISDGLLVAAAAEGKAGRRSALPLDEGLLGSWTGPFGWFVIAQPLTPAELRKLSDDTGSRQRVAEGTADRFPGQAALAQRRT